MKVLGFLVLTGLLAGCGKVDHVEEASKNISGASGVNVNTVETVQQVFEYKEFMELAQTDSQELLKATENGVMVKFNIADLSRIQLDKKKFGYMVIKPANGANDSIGFTIMFPIDEEAKISKNSDNIAFCKSRVISKNSVGITIRLTDCTISLM